MGNTGGKQVAQDGTGELCCGATSYRELQLTGLGVVQMDPWLEPFSAGLRSRYARAQKWIKNINETEGGLEKFSRGFERYGFLVQRNGDIIYREWAPNALRAYLIGDFSESCHALSASALV